MSNEPLKTMTKPPHTASDGAPTIDDMLKLFDDSWSWQLKKVHELCYMFTAEKNGIKLSYNCATAMLAVPALADEAKPDKNGCYRLDKVVPKSAGEHKINGGPSTFVENTDMINEVAKSIPPDKLKDYKWCPSRVE